MHFCIYSFEQTNEWRWKKKDVNLTLCNLIMHMHTLHSHFDSLAIDFANSFCDHCIEMNYQVLVRLNIHVYEMALRAVLVTRLSLQRNEVHHMYRLCSGEQEKKTRNARKTNRQYREQKRIALARRSRRSIILWSILISIKLILTSDETHDLDRVFMKFRWSNDGKSNQIS